MIAIILSMLLSLAQPAPTAADATVVVSGTTASVYLTINNPTMYAIYVVSATSNAAALTVTAAVTAPPGPALPKSAP